MKKLSILAIILLCGSMAIAQPKQGAMKGKQRNMEQRIEKRADKCPLGLTEEQQEQVKAQKIKSEKQILALENQIREKKARLRTLETADKADLKAINSTIEEIGKLKMEKEKIEAADRQFIRSMLTEEQRLMFDSRDRKHGDDRMMRHHMGMRMNENQQPTPVD